MNNPHPEGSLALYEIETLTTGRRLSLVSYGDFPSDVAAILVARLLVRKGEGLEVWRGAVLVYRLAPPGWNARPRPQTGTGMARPYGGETPAAQPYPLFHPIQPVLRHWFMLFSLWGHVRFRR